MISDRRAAQRLVCFGRLSDGRQWVFEQGVFANPSRRPHGALNPTDYAPGRPVATGSAAGFVVGAVVGAVAGASAGTVVGTVTGRGRMRADSFRSASSFQDVGSCPISYPSFASETIVSFTKI